MKIANPISYQIWEDRYKKNDESLTENFQRVAKYCGNSKEEQKEFFDVMNAGLFFPAGRTMSNAGIGDRLTLNNCFTLNSIPDDMEKIFDTVKIGALTHKAGGGTGYDFSGIRPKGMPTHNDAIASGVLSFMSVFDKETGTILQGNRRGANMGVLNIYHYDIYDFINAKSTDADAFKFFNLSVMVDDDFMEAKNNNDEIYLRWPVYDSVGNIIKDESKWKIKKKIKAQDLWNEIMQKAYDTGEPGILQYSSMNRNNNTYYMENILGTNPCAEYISGALFGDNIDSDKYKGACNLGSIFIHRFVKHPFTEDVCLDWDKLSNAIKIAVRFLDNIIDKNFFPYKDYENYQKNMRTIGLGVTGLGSLFSMFQIEYGTDESVELTDKLFNFITYHTYRESINLAKEKGSFPFCDNQKFANSYFIKKHIDKYPAWENIQSDIEKYGIRNARCISIAPTGTLSLTYGENCSSGIEPIFCLSYQRKVKIGGQSDDDIQIVDMMDAGYQFWNKIGKPKVKDGTFKTAMELEVSAHLKVLSTIAFHVDMSVSKTINIPTEYPYEDTKKVYDYCWEHDIKGCTIFRPNPIRQGILISNNSTNNNKNTNSNAESDFPRGFIETVPSDLTYRKYKLETGCTKLFLFVGVDEAEGKIYDVFTNTNGASGCPINTQAVSRLLSAGIRGGIPIEYLVDQMDKAGVCPSFQYRRGKGDSLCKGKSCASAIGNVLRDIIKEFKNNETSTTIKEYSLSNEDRDYIEKYGEVAFAKKYNRCPECGNELQHVDGCIGDYTGCGWSKCGA